MGGGARPAGARLRLEWLHETLRVLLSCSLRLLVCRVAGAQLSRQQVVTGQLGDDRGGARRCAVTLGRWIHEQSAAVPTASLIPETAPAPTAATG